MQKPEDVSATARELIALVENAATLATYHHKRDEAKDVLKAACIYAKERNFELPYSAIEDFMSVLYDARPESLQYLAYDIVSKILDIDYRKRKERSKQKI